MKSKLQRKIDGPGWVEVFFGAALSVLLGVVLAAVFLVSKPVTTVKELPKEPVPKMVYYIEGSRESSKIRGVDAKRKLLAQGGSVVLSEDELLVGYCDWRSGVHCRARGTRPPLVAFRVRSQPRR